MARRARKYYLGLVTITQQVADLADDGHGETILSNAAQVLLLKQKADTIDAATARFRLTAEERQLLLGADKGEGLLLVRGNRIPLQVVASKAEYRLATTNPRDLEELAAAAAAVPETPRVPPSNGAAEPGLGGCGSGSAACRAGTLRSARMESAMIRSTDPGRRIDTETLKRERPLADVVASYGIALRRESAGTYRALCPFHQEHTPSFWIDARDGNSEHYFCFGCTSSGDVITFVMEREGCSFQEACERLSTRSRPPMLEPPQQRTSAPAAGRRWEDLPADSAEARVLDLALQVYQAELWRNARAQAYLRSRGCSRGCGTDTTAWLRRRCALFYAGSGRNPARTCCRWRLAWDWCRNGQAPRMTSRSIASSSSTV